MAEPESRDLGGRDQDLDHRAEDGLEDGQREPGAGLAEGAGGEGAAGQQGDVGQGRVAVEHLDEEPVDNGRWGQEATVAPRVACLAAGVVDEVATELGGEVLPEGVEGGRNPSMHRGAPGPRWGRKITMCTGVPLFPRDEAAWGYRCLNAIRAFPFVFFSTFLESFAKAFKMGCCAATMQSGCAVTQR